MLKNMAHKYRQMPNGGAALQVHPDGAVANGMAIIERFGDVKTATTALKEAGFVERHYGWKIPA